MALLLRDKIKRPLPLLIGLISGGILLVGTTAYLNAKNPNAETQLEKLTVPSQTQNLMVEIKASGTVEPIQSVNISPKNPGRLAELKVEQGDNVTQGQVLAVMENAQLKAQEMQQKANLQQALAKLQEAKVTLPGEIAQAKARLNKAQANLSSITQSQPRQVDQAQAQLNAAQARYNLAKDRLRRNEYLVKEGAVAQDQFDETTNEYRNAEALLLEAQKRFEQARETKTPDIDQSKASLNEADLALNQKINSLEAEIASYEAQVQSAQAQLDVIRVQLDDTIIRAPFTGIVSQRYANIGAFVTPTVSASATASATSTSILALAQGIEVVAKVPEVDIGQLKPGQKVQIIADAFPDQVFEGEVKRIAPEAVVDQNVTSFEVFITILTGADLLRSKMNVDVTFIGKEIDNAVVIPTVAIVTQQGQTGVLVPDENKKPEFKQVTIGTTQQDKTQVLKGLSAGERVFIDLPKDYKQDNK